MLSTLARSTLLAAIGLIVAVNIVHADTNLSTGIDSNWTYEGASASIVNHTDADFYAYGTNYGWASNTAASSWIAAHPDQTFGNGNSDYTLNFTVSGPVKSFFASWAVDDQGVLLLNGIEVGSLGLGYWTALTSVGDLSKYLSLGQNTLTIRPIVVNDYATGVRFEGTLVADVPGPVAGAGLPAFFAGLGALGLRARRKIGA